jgi:hypothetical protein
MHLDLNITNKKDITRTLNQQGFCWVNGAVLGEISSLTSIDFSNFTSYWEDLVEDQFLKDLGRYRFRRHSSYVVSGGKSELMPHRAHWQSLDYNALHGGIKRMFEPIDPALNASPKWLKLIAEIPSLFLDQNSHPGQDKDLTKEWFTEAHQFRINTFGGIGRPTPEGAHRDGVDYVALILVNRKFIKGGETRIFNIDGNEGLRFTLDEPWSMLLIDDHKIIHETTPIQDNGGSGFRDTLVLTYRKGEFQQSK